MKPGMNTGSAQGREVKANAGDGRPDGSTGVYYAENLTPPNSLIGQSTPGTSSAASPSGDRKHSGPRARLFSGRIDRTRFFMRTLYWLASAGVVLHGIVLPLLLHGLGLRAEAARILGDVITMAVWLIALSSLTVRRLHDLNRPGWFVFVWLIPIVDFVFALALVAVAGTLGDNRYGPVLEPQSLGKFRDPDRK